MAPKNWFFISLFIFSTLSGIHCGRAPQAIPLVDVDPSIGTPNFGEAPVYYPHGEGWKDPTTHGAAYRSTIRNGQDPQSSFCVVCHNFRKEAPTCTSCHPLFPHRANWQDPLNHGAHVRENGTTTCETSCHGDSLTNGLSGISCKSCHHPKGWAAPDKHGSYVIQNDKESCKRCHGDDYKGGVIGSSCYNSSCHTAYPHLANWAQVEQHGFFAHETGKEDCKACHGGDFKGGISKISCYNANCHTVYPHLANWTQPENHGAAAVGEGKEDCKSCHGEDFTGGISGITCYNSNCHASYPHNNQWGQSDQHGLFVLLTGKNDCKKCHGQDLQGGISEVSCSSCHKAYPHADGWKDAHGSNLTSLPGDIFTNIDQNCQTSNCHGDQGVSRGIPQCSSSDCHPSFPDRHRNNDVWKAEGAEGHRQHALQEGTSECAKCHYKENTWSCYSCHEKYPHTDDWIQADNHGASVLIKNFFWRSPHDKFNQPVFDSKCKNCHGPTVLFDNADPPTLTGDFTENGVKRCYNQACHPNYPHIYYDALHPILADLGLRISQDWPDGHRNFIYYNEGYVGISPSNPQCRTQACYDQMTDLLTSTPDQKGCYGASGGVCHNNNRHHPGWHVFNPYCEAACHIEQ